ncbi:MAG TPA: isocitrate/isopropylmalate dehydrogenase family protein [Candidatus Thermoplasmatota archaeon]|nr:isocitrate/isopropylmalate dehydrogenase family protein [Candidatus Thermoplasmatota archaeon]
MAKAVAVIPGDGIGPEVVGAALTVLDALDVELDYLHANAGLECKRRTGTYLPEATLAAVREADAVLFGAITSPLASEDPHYTSVILALRNELDAYANVRPARDLGQPCLAKGLDLVLVRENSEGMYNAPETEDEEGVTTHRRISRRGSERVIRFAFEWAQRRGRKQLHCLHKANVLRKSDGLFLSTFRETAKAFPRITAKEMLLDNAAMQLVLRPQQFDMLVTMNLYGDVLSDEMAGLVGGLGFAPSGSFGPRAALFEPVHGSAPDIAGKGVANPCGAILSAAMMLEYLGHGAEAHRVEAAVRAALGEGTTPDAGGTLSTEAFTAAVVANLK